jgi:uncharacterized protein YkwD
VGTQRSRMAVAMFVCGMTFAVPAGASAVGNELPQRMVAAVNAVRAEHGLPGLRDSPALHRSARRYSKWMLRADYFGHLGRIRASGRFSLLGENLAWHTGPRPLVWRTVRSWMRSPAHRGLILHPGFHWLGAGPARGRLGSRPVTAWVLHFGGGLSLPADQLPSEASIPSASLEIAATTSAAGRSSASAAP